MRYDLWPEYDDFLEPEEDDYFDLEWGYSLDLGEDDYFDTEWGYHLDLGEIDFSAPGKDDYFDTEDDDCLGPEPGDYLECDGYNVRLCSEEGFMKGEWDITSGVPGSRFQDQGRSNYGPIPEGTYIIDPKEIDYLDPSDSWASGDWGKTRVRLIPTPETKAEQLRKKIDRWALFAHGGKRPGTWGCIDLGDDEEDFFNTLKQYDWPLYLEVEYYF